MEGWDSLLIGACAGLRLLLLIGPLQRRFPPEAEIRTNALFILSLGGRSRPLRRSGEEPGSLPGCSVVASIDHACDSVSLPFRATRLSGEPEALHTAYLQRTCSRKMPIGRASVFSALFRLSLVSASAVTGLGYERGKRQADLPCACGALIPPVMFPAWAFILCRYETDELAGPPALSDRGAVDAAGHSVEITHNYSRLPAAF